MSIPPATQDRNPHRNRPMWSKKEKAIARTAFDAALNRELQEVIEKTKQMANAIGQAADLWDLEKFLTRRRKEIDRKYEFRESRRIDVLGRLLYENRLAERDLDGLSADKVESIRSFAKFLQDDAA